MRVGVYSRVSKDKKGKDRSISFQEKDGKHWAEQNGYVCELYTEKEGTSGTLTSEYRPMFAKLIHDINKGIISCVYAYDMSRLERNEHDRYALFYALRNKKGTLYTNRDGFVDFEKPEIKLSLDIVSAMNGYFVALTKENVKGKLRENIIEGRVHSAPQFGYMNENKMLVVNPETAPIVERIFNLCISGNGGNTIARILSEDGIPTPTFFVGPKKLVYRTHNIKEKVTVNKEGMKWNGATINRILKSKLYKGERHWNDEVYPITPIITLEVWEKAQESIRNNKNNSQNNTTHDYLIKGKIFCGDCGQGYHGYTQEKRNISVYQCYQKRIVNKVSEFKCTNKRVDKVTIEDIVWQRVIGNPLLLQVLKQDFDFENLNEKVDYTKELARVKNEITTLNNGKQTLISLVSKGIIEESDLVLQLAPLNNDIKKLTRRFDELTLKHDIIVNQKEVLSEVATFQQNLAKFENPPFELKRKLIEIFIDNIVIKYDKTSKLTELQISLKLNLQYHSLSENLAVDLRQYERNLVTHQPPFR